VLTTTLTRARERLETRWGADPNAWRWGEAAVHSAPHIAFRDIPFVGQAFERRIRSVGAPDSVNVFSFAWSAGADPERSSGIPGMRMIVDLADPERALFALNSGQSGHFRSPHYHDLAELLATGEYFRIDDPGGEARTLRLQPGAEQ
jgi:penicillin amidase